jgi:hypothetical protein
VWSRALKRLFFERFPDDLRPGRLSRIVAHFSTAIEMLIPLALFFSHGGWPTAIAAFVMVVFHLGSCPRSRWVSAGVECLYDLQRAGAVRRARRVGVTDLNTPWPSCCSRCWCAASPWKPVPAQGFLPARHAVLRRQLDSSLWCLKPSASEKIAKNLVAIASMPHAQLEKVYGSREAAAVLQYLGYSFRCFNTHGRMIHPGPPGDGREPETDYVMTDGERICSTAIGWNFGDGHMHNEQLIAAMQRRCHFEPGEVRVVLIDAQPIHIQAQRYRLVDATGEFESGYIRCPMR